MSGLRQIACSCETTTPCCAGIERDPIDAVAAERLAAGLKALADPFRVAIVHLLSAATGPVCVVDIERHLPLAQSTVSYHLKTLVDAGVLDRERRGRWSYYTVCAARLGELIEGLASLSTAPGTESGSK